MDNLLGIASKVGQSQARSDDDFVDRLNHRYTTFVLVVFAIVVSTKQYAGEPINCWCPAQFNENWRDYTNKVCWVSNTYYVPLREKLPDRVEREQYITYYQWVPMILLVQAMFFFLPCMVWRFMNNQLGIDVNNIVESAMTIQHTGYTETMDKTVRFMAAQLERYLVAQRDFRQGCLVGLRQYLARRNCLVCGRRYGNYLVSLYILTKLFYLTNVVTQLFALNAFLGNNYHMYGIQVLRALLNGEDFIASSMFPRVTMCKFEVRVLGNNHEHNVQCVLPINLFNEKIYIFVWFWLVLVAIASLYSVFKWILICAHRADQLQYVRRHLRAKDRMKKGEAQDKKKCKAFVHEYLRQDGVLLLRLVALNSNEIVVAELVSKLWDNYCTQKPLLESKDTNEEDLP